MSNFLKTHSFSVYVHQLAGIRIPFVSRNGYSFGTSPFWVFVEICSDVLNVIMTVTISAKYLSPDISIDDRCIGSFQFMTCVQSMAKLIHFTLKRNTFKDLIGMWEESFGMDAEVSIELMRVERKRVKSITLVLLSAMAFVVIPYTSLPLIPAIQAITGKKLSVVSTFFYNIDNSPAFEATIIFQAICGWFTIFKLIAYDTLFLTLASLHIMQLKKLKYDLGKVFDGMDSKMDHEDINTNENHLKGIDNRLKYRKRIEGDSFEEECLNKNSSSNFKENVKYETVKSRLNIWAIQHQQAIRFGNELQDLYSPMWLVLFSTSLLILLFTAFVAVVVSLSSMQYILLTGYVIGSSIQLYMVCQCGDRLNQESSVLSEDGFSSAWYQCPKDIRTSMKIIFQRAQVHLELSAFGVVPLSSETFQWIVKSTVSYFTVLLNLRNGDHADLTQ